MKKILMLLFVTLMCLVPLFSEADQVGNLFYEDDDSSISVVKRDLMWVGDKTDLSDLAVGSSMLLAGETIEIEDSSVGGSIRAAGNKITVSDTKVQDNITAAGQYVRINEGTSMAAALLAGRVVTFDGNASDLKIAAAETILDGKIDGDVYVYSGTVKVNPTCVITGTLNVESSKLPVVANGAKIGNTNFHLTNEDIDVAVEKAIKPVSFLTKVWRTFRAMLGCGVVALLLTLVFPKAAGNTAALLVKRPWQVPLSGLITILALAPACLILIILGGPGILLGVSLTMVATALGLICIPVIGANIALLVFPKMKPILSALIGGATLALLSRIPVLGAIIIILSVFCVIGYVIQAWFLAKKPQVL